MATLKEMLAGLTNEELDALEQEFLTAQATGGNIAGGDMSTGRGVLPQRAGLGSRIGMGVLRGAQAAGESVVRDVRAMAGFKPPERTIADELREFELKERMKKNIRGETTEPFSITEDFEIPEGYEIAGYDQKGQPMIRKIKLNIAEEKFNIAQEEKKKTQEEKSQLVRESALDMLDTIDEVEKGIGYFGLTGQLPSIPGTARKTWEANVNKLLSGKIINLMTSMKEASKTGATGFGQLSEKELKVLQEASTALKRELSPKSAQIILNDMRAKVKKIAEGNSGDITSTQEITPEEAIAELKKRGKL